MLVNPPEQSAVSSADFGNLENKSALSPSWISYLVEVIRSISTKLDSWFPFFLGLKVLTFVLVFSWYAILPVRLTSVTDPDLGWHLRSGEWITQHLQLPRTDPFSITGAGKPWVAYSWPFSVLIYEIAKNFDLLGVAAYTLLGWVAIVAALFVLVRAQGAGFWRAAGLTLIAGAILQRVVSPRPGTITMLFFVVLFQILLRQREKGYTRRLWLVPFIIWIWANVHVQFVYGLLVIGMFCIEPLLDRLFLRRERAHKLSLQLWAVLGVSTLATLLNPYGFGPYHVILDFLHQPLLAQQVQETKAMPFTFYGNYLVLFLTLGAAAVLGRRRPIEPLWVMLLLWATVSAFRMERDIWLAATVTLAIIAMPSRKTQPESRESSRLWLYGTVGVLIVIFAMLEHVPSNKKLLGMVATQLPVGAVAYIHEHHLSGPIFNDYDWGGFLIYALPELPVSIDGRTNIHGQDEVGRSGNTWALRPGWDNDPLLKQANLIIGSPWRPLTNYLVKDPHYKVVFDDGVCVLFEKVGSSSSPIANPVGQGKPSVKP